MVLKIDEIVISFLFIRFMLTMPSHSLGTLWFDFVQIIQILISSFVVDLKLLVHKPWKTIMYMCNLPFHSFKNICKHDFGCAKLTKTPKLTCHNL